MGDMADWAEGQAFKQMALYDSLEHDGRRLIYEYKMGVCKWTQKNGDKILVQNMELSHIHNCLKIMSKKDDPRVEAWREIFNAEITKRTSK
jgi:hypothetical protein